MSIHPPPRNWFKGPEGGERLWIGMGFVWCMVLFLAMPFAHFKGKQNSTGESYRVEPTAFMDRVVSFTTANQVGEFNGIPIAEPAPAANRPAADGLQLQLFDAYEHPLIDKLRRLEVDGTTPIDALLLLREWKDSLGG